MSSLSLWDKKGDQPSGTEAENIVCTYIVCTLTNSSVPCFIVFRLHSLVTNSDFLYKLFDNYSFAIPLTCHMSV